MSVTFDDAAAQKAMQEGARRLQRTATFFQQHLQQRLSVSNPKPYLNSSVPGQYPRKRTGNLIANIIWGPTSVAGIFGAGMKVRIGINQPGHYGIILEFFRKRLGFIQTMNDLKPVLQAMLKGKAP